MNNLGQHKVFKSHICINNDVECSLAERSTLLIGEALPDSHLMVSSIDTADSERALCICMDGGAIASIDVHSDISSWSAEVLDVSGYGERVLSGRAVAAAEEQQQTQMERRKAP